MPRAFIVRFILILARTRSHGKCESNRIYRPPGPSPLRASEIRARAYTRARTYQNNAAC